MIDFRVRPPFGKSRGMGIFAGLMHANDSSKDAALYVERKRVSSAIACDEGLFMLEMDLAGVDYSVLMGRKTNTDTNGSTDNAELFALRDRHPERFFVFAGIDPHEKDCIDQIKAAVDQGAKGVGLDPGWYADPIRADDPMLMPVYEACVKYGLIASITTSIFLGPDHTWSDPAPIQRVANKFPEMKIVVPHACFPWIPQALGVALICPNVYLMPDCYFYTPNMPFANEIAEAANGYLRDRLLFASSYPVSGFQGAIDGWKARPLSRDALVNSMHYNAAKLLGL